MANLFDKKNEGVAFLIVRNRTRNRRNRWV